MKLARPRPVETAARFCLSCVGTLACWCVWLVLGGLLAVQLYVALARELPVPHWVLQRLETQLTEVNLRASFASAQFDPTGRLLLEAPRVRTLTYEDPILIARTIYVRKSFWSVLSGERAPDEIRIDGGTLQLPAPLSPSGTPAPLLRDLAATVRISGTLVQIDQLAFRAGNLDVTMAGEIELPARASGRRLEFAAVLGQALQSGRRLVRELERLNILQQPALHVQLSARPGIGNVAELSLVAAGLRQPAGELVETGPLRVTTLLRIAGDAPRPLRLNFSAASVRYGTQTAHAGKISGVLATELRQLTEPPDRATVQLAGDRLAVAGEQVEAPVVLLRWQRDAPLDFNLAARVHREVLAVSGRADLEHRSAELQFAGRVPPSLVTAILPRRAPRFAPYFQFGDPVRIHATAEFTGGWKFESLHARVRGGRLNSNGVAVTSTRGRIDIDAAGNFHAYDAVVGAEENHARGSYWMNFHSRDYRMLLTGALHPPHITGWFRSQWWPDFWSNFAFGGAPPEADIDLIGNWRDPRETTYFGRTDAELATVLGADFDQAHARVFVRPQFAHAFDIRAARADGQQQVRGWFKRTDGARAEADHQLEFDLTGNLDAATLRQFGGEKAAPLLEPWVFSAPPTIELRGQVATVDGRPVPNFSFRGQTDGNLTLKGFPLERVAVSGAARDDEVRLDLIDLAIGGGRGTARALVDGPAEARRLGFDFFLEQADLVRTIGALGAYDRPEGGAAPANRDLLKRASGGRLNLAISADGRLADLATFTGAGNVEIAGAELGEIQLFGLLSQVLSAVSLNFSSLKLDTLRSSYRLADGRLHFPDLRVTGSTALIEARGDYRLLDKTLDFTARLRPYDENRNLITGMIGMVVNPLTSILELRLTGSIRNPNWSLSVGATSPREPAAPATQTPAGVLPAKSGR